jgi:hypothetical protein
VEYLGGQRFLKEVDYWHLEDSRIIFAIGVLDWTTIYVELLIEIRIVIYASLKSMCICEVWYLHSRDYLNI